MTRPPLPVCDTVRCDEEIDLLVPGEISLLGAPLVRRREVGRDGVVVGARFRERCQVGAFPHDQGRVNAKLPLFRQLLLKHLPQVQRQFRK